MASAAVKLALTVAKSADVMPGSASPMSASAVWAVFSSTPVAPLHAAMPAALTTKTAEVAPVHPFRTYMQHLQRNTNVDDSARASARTHGIPHSEQNGL